MVYKKGLIWALVLFCSIFSETLTIKRSYNADSLAVFKEGYTLNQSPGEPALPVDKISVLLPADADLATVVIRKTNNKSRECNISKAVSKVEFYRENGELITHNMTVSEVFQAGSPFPQSPIRDTHCGQAGRAKILSFTFFPVQYCESELSLHITSEVSFEISYQREESSENLISQQIVKRLQQRVINKSDIEKFYSVKRAGNRLVIVTTEAIKNNLSKLAQFIALKEGRGYSVTVVTEADWGGGTGDAASENLRSWLEENYLSMNIDYLLLIGDPSPYTGDLPMKIAYAYYSGKKAPTDFYYAELTGNWDADGDGKYGELDDLKKSNGIDAIADIAVGRIPCYNRDYSAVDDILMKSMTYESAKESEIGWRKNMLLAMDGYYGSEGPEMGEKLKEDVAALGGWDFYRIYCKMAGGCDEWILTERAVTDAWKSGQYGIVSWLTHGKEDAALHIMNNSYAQELSDDYPSFVMMGSCLNGKPDVTNNLAYTVLKKGAIGVVSGSETTIYRQPMGDFVGSSYNHGFIHGFTLNLAKANMTVSDALDYTKEKSDMGCWKNYCAFNLYGDPTLGLYSSGAQTPITESAAISNNRPDISISNRTVYANFPTSDKKVLVTLYSLQGQIVQRKTVSTDALTKGVKLNTLSTSQNLYILECKGAQHTVTKAVTNI